MKKKGIVSAFCLLLALLFTLTACGTTTATTDAAATTAATTPAVKGTIQVESGYDTEIVIKAFTQVAMDFQAANPGIFVQITNVGAQNYNTLMQVKLAANDLPDCFGTAGWVPMYAPYVMDLTNEPWVSRIQPNIKGAVTFQGKVCALPLNSSIMGLGYNVDVLAKYGVNPDTDLKTLDAWMAACKKIWDGSNHTVWSMYIGGGDGWPLALFYNFLADSAFVNNNPTDKAALLDGTFDWSKWVPFAQKMKALSAYFNPDYLVAKASPGISYEAQGKAAFMWGMNDVPGIHAITPGANLNYVPFPAYKDGDPQMMVGDVRDTMAIWKDTKIADACKMFVNFWAQPQELKKLCDATTMFAGLTGVDVAGVDTARMAQFSNVPVYSIFDQMMLGNGMWDTMVKGAGEYHSGSETAQQFADLMKASYLRLKNWTKLAAQQVK